MADVFEKAWGNYLAMLEFLTNPDGQDGGFNDQKGLLQLYNFATLLGYSEDAPNFNDFLLNQSIDYAAPGTPDNKIEDDFSEKPNLNHTVKLTESYSQFLDVLDVLLDDAVDPTDLPEYEPYRTKVREAQRELNGYQSYVNSEWKDWVASNPGVPIDELQGRRIIWERDFGHSKELATLRRSLVTSQVRRNAWLRRKIDASLHRLVDARNYFDDPNHMVKLPVSAAHEDRPQYWQDFHMQLPTVTIRDFLKNDDLVQSSFSTEEEHYRRVETKWKVKVKGRWGIFKGGGSAERRKLEEVSEKKSFSVSISMSKFQEVDVFRAQWFQPMLFETVGRQFKEFWGPGGLLATYPISLLICRGLTVKVQVDEEYRSLLEKFFNGGGRASFGPFFSGGGSYSKNEKYMDFTKTSQGFELKDNVKTIRLLGCRVRRPNWSQSFAENYWQGISREELEGITDDSEG
ncbi:hypothetical protein LCM19_13085 [Qipengyuania flava]|nr:hypothetical protein [Qipengyuania flava]